MFCFFNLLLVVPHEANHITLVALSVIERSLLIVIYNDSGTSKDHVRSLKALLKNSEGARSSGEANWHRSLSFREHHCFVLAVAMVQGFSDSLSNRVICLPKYSLVSLKICGFSSLLVSLILV